MRDLAILLTLSVLMSISVAAYLSFPRVYRGEGWDQIERARSAPDAAPGGSPALRKVHPSNG